MLTCVGAFLMLITVGIVKVAYDYNEQRGVVASEDGEPTRIYRTRKAPLPSKCAHLLDPGNTDLSSPWKTCMGVQAK